MKSVLLIKKTGLLLLMIAVVAACNKDKGINYRDASMGNGQEGPNITIDTSVKNIDVSKYAQARVFPGLVCNSERRIMDTALSLNLNYNLVTENLRISIPPQPQFSTGLYAAPGELVVIDVPSNYYSLSIQIGAWTDNLSSIQNPPRDPIIFTKMQLAPGRNYIRNLYGGHIYIFSAVPIREPVNLVFSNVTKSPDFVLGKTSAAEWAEAVRTSCVPWLELRSKNMIFVVSTDYCRKHPISDPVKVMEIWDDIISLDFYEWEGLVENASDEIDKAPLLPWRVVLDIKPVVGYGHNGFPIVAQNDGSWFLGISKATSIDGGGSWGYLHELGHNNQQGRYWSWSTLGETTCNLFSFKVANRLASEGLGTWPPGHPGVYSDFPKAIAFATETKSGKDFNGTDERINSPFARLTPFVQIFDKKPAGMNYDSWGFMAELYKKARRASRISITDQDKHDFVYEALCDYTQKDWIYFFKAWGINISNISSTKMSAKYTPMAQKIWEYNPITRTGGNATFNPDPYDRSNWSVVSFTSEEKSGEGAGNGVATAILDGDPATYWHSQWAGSNIPNPPYYITVDMGAALSINGFEFTQRNGQRKMNKIHVETSPNGTTWTAAPGSPYSLTSVTTPQTVSFAGGVSVACRYFRLIFKPETEGDGTKNAAMAEVNVTH